MKISSASALWPRKPTRTLKPWTAVVPTCRFSSGGWVAGFGGARGPVYFYEYDVEL